MPNHPVRIVADVYPTDEGDTDDLDLMLDLVRLAKSSP